MAELQIKYDTRATMTITLASLATNSSGVFTAGREGTYIDNTTTLYDDVLVTGQITTGTSPTASRTIAVFVYAGLDDTPTFPDVLDGTDSTETFTSANVLNSAIRLASAVRTDNTSDRAYFFTFQIAGLFGGIMPRHWGIYVAHDTAQNLNSTGGNHYFKYQGITYQTIT